MRRYKTCKKSVMWSTWPCYSVVEAPGHVTGKLRGTCCSHGQVKVSGDYAMERKFRIVAFFYIKNIQQKVGQMGQDLGTLMQNAKKFLGMVRFLWQSQWILSQFDLVLFEFRFRSWLSSGLDLGKFWLCPWFTSSQSSIRSCTQNANVFRTLKILMTVKFYSYYFL